MNKFKPVILLGLLLFMMCNNATSQSNDRIFSIGAGVEYPIIEKKYDPMFTFDIYIYCIGLETDFGLLYNNRKVTEFEIGRRLGTTFNLNLFTKFDLSRINPGLHKFMLIPGYKYSQHTLTQINDLKGKSHYLFLKTEFNVNKWFIVYNKLDFKLNSNQYLSSSDILISFGLKFSYSKRKDF